MFYVKSDTAQMHIKTGQVKMLIHASLAPRSVDILEKQKSDW